MNFRALENEKILNDEKMTRKAMPHLLGANRLIPFVCSTNLRPGRSWSVDPTLAQSQEAAFSANRAASGTLTVLTLEISQTHTKLHDFYVTIFQFHRFLGVLLAIFISNRNYNARKRFV